MNLGVTFRQFVDQLRYVIIEQESQPRSTAAVFDPNHNRSAIQ